MSIAANCNLCEKHANFPRRLVRPWILLTNRTSFLLPALTNNPALFSLYSSAYHSNSKTAAKPIFEIFENIKKRKWDGINNNNIRSAVKVSVPNKEHLPPNFFFCILSFGTRKKAEKSRLIDANDFCIWDPRALIKKGGRWIIFHSLCPSSYPSNPFFLRNKDWWEDRHSPF